MSTSFRSSGEPLTFDFGPRPLPHPVPRTRTSSRLASLREAIVRWLHQEL